MNISNAYMKLQSMNCSILVEELKVKKVHHLFHYRGNGKVVTVKM